MADSRSHMRIGHGYVWLSNGREGKVWRFLPQKAISAAPHPWTDDAQQVDLDGYGKPDLLVEDLATFIPGEPVKFHMKLLNASAGSSFQSACARSRLPLRTASPT